jgi:hypothetical protein
MRIAATQLPTHADDSSSTPAIGRRGWAIRVALDPKQFARARP